MKYQRRRVDWARHDEMMLVVACGGASMASLSIVSLAIRLVF